MGVIRQLLDEIVHEKEQLGLMTEQYETAAGVMAALFEQMWAVNEQLRSRVEELEASKEELQVVNDELLALNDELGDKVEEINRVNTDLQQLVTERTEQIKRLTSELILSEQAERQRIAQLLHDDLQQLLFAIQMRVTMVSRGLSAEQAAHLAEVTTLVAQVLSVIRNLTVELSPPVLAGEEADITTTLDWLVLRMAHVHGLRVDVASTCPVRVPAHVNMLVYRLVRELLFNVVKHAGVDRAHVKLTREADRLVLLVEDEGAGFDPAVRHRWPATRGGFGLHSVKERLTLLGGRLETDAAPGRGTRMTLFIPLEPEHAAVDDAGPPGLIRSVYIVDDDADVREALVMLIEDEPDLEVCGVAAAASEALAAIPGAAPDLVLTDLSMPGMSGVKLVEQLLIQNPRQRVAVLSGHPEPFYAEQARGAGARGYILKGDAQAMLEGIRHVLRDGAWAGAHAPAPPGGTGHTAGPF